MGRILALHCLPVAPAHGLPRKIYEDARTAESSSACPVRRQTFPAEPVRRACSRASTDHSKASTRTSAVRGLQCELTRNSAVPEPQRSLFRATSRIIVEVPKLEILSLVVLGALVWLWFDILRARE